MKELQIFSYEGSMVRTVNENGEPWFVAVDACNILELGNPAQALSRLDDDEKNTIILNEGIPGNPEKLIISEPGLYTLILGSRKPEARKFKRWVTHEVIPAIRKHGLYAMDEIIANPDLALNALIALKAERERNYQLELDNAVQRQQIAELQPKASYYDLILQNKSAVPISLIAKDYGMSGRTFNELLHTLGVQYKFHRTWLLYQEFANQGYTQSKTFVVDAEKNVMHTYWTQKGRLFIYDLLKSEGVLPVIEREVKLDVPKS